MARESRRKRAERRFGKAERLADRFIEGQAKIPEQWGELFIRCHPDLDDDEVFRTLAALMGFSTAICADELVEFVESRIDQRDVSWTGLPTGVPPFQHTLIEYCYRSLRCLSVNHALDDNRSVKGYFFMWSGDAVVGPLGTWEYQLDAQWKIQEEVKVFCYVENEIAEATMIRERTLYACYLSAIAYAFMAAKNVELRVIENDEKVARERTKAGLKEFLRYHTINISPVARLIKSETSGARIGIARALSLVRTHLVTLTKNNKGELLPEPTIYLREAHVRGKAKNGVVVSDYNVKAPAQG